MRYGYPRVYGEDDTGVIRGGHLGARGGCCGDFTISDNGGSTVVHMAPNTTYAGAGATNLSPIYIPAALAIGSANGRLLFEANTVQYCSATALGTAYAYGWKDAVNAN